ncbi:MAG: molybdopterin-binding protein, partial [Acidobacteriota bacterium]
MITKSEVIGTLVTIGDEILLGDIPNGNAHHIAMELRCRGFRLDRMVTVGDREEEIVSTLSQCLERSDFLIVTGGLGPTDDD